MAKSDIQIRITYPIGKDSEFKIDTNAKKDKLKEILEEFIRCQIGEGGDKRPPEERKVYEIDIDLYLADDSWVTRHNCGNCALRDGIIMDIINRLD